MAAEPSWAQGVVSSNLAAPTKSLFENKRVGQLPFIVFVFPSPRLCHNPS
jgi:hypothetical protein